MMRARKREYASCRPHGLLAVCGLLVLVLVSGGYWFYRYQERAVQREIEARLLAIARVKADQIAAWRNDQWVDAGILAANPFLVEGLAELWSRPDQKVTALLNRYLRQVRKEHDYADVLIADTEGRVRFSLNARTALPEVLHAASSKALRERARVVVDLTKVEGDAAPLFAVVAPLYSDYDQEARGTLVLVNDPSRYLYPLIQSVLTPSESEEMFLIRHEGEGVRMLSDLRNRPGTALRLLVPLSGIEQPMMEAMLGEQAVVRGRDYRGVEVLAAVLPVPDAPWFVVAKMDAAEAFAAWRFHSLLILSLVGALGACLVVGGGMVWQRQRLAHERERHRVEAQRHVVAERCRVVLNSIGDAVLVTDADGRVELLNEVAEELTGWTNAEAQGRPLGEVFRLVNEENGESVEYSIHEAVGGARSKKPGNTTLLIVRDGTRRPITFSSAPVRDETGAATGGVLVARDQSDQFAFQKELRASEERYRTLIESAPEPIFVQTEGRFAYVNPACLRLLGAEQPEALLGQPVLERFHPAYHASIRQRIRRLNEGLEPVELAEEAVVSLSGEVIPVEVAAVPLQYEGKFGALVYAHDIRSRKRAEEALAQNYEMLARTEKLAKIGSWEWDVAADVVRWSDELFHVFGMPPAKRAPPFAEHARLFVPEDFARLRAAVDACVADGTPYDIELRAVRADGTVVHCVAHGQAERDEQGRICRLVGSFQDITERKEAENEQKRLTTAIEQAVEAIEITDPEGVIQYVNPAFERITGYRRKEVLGRKPNILKSGEHDEAFYAELWETIASGRVWRGELINRRKDGSLYTEESTISPVFDDAGALANYVAVKHDVSERKRMEKEREELESQVQQAQKLESIGRLAGGVAHDFNNILQVMRGCSGILLNMLPQGEEPRALVEEIGQGVERATELTQQLLGFARKQTISPRVLDLNETVESMLKMLRRLIGEDIDLAWLPEPGVWPVRMDPIQVNQVLANLCVNARDAINGAGKITIETENVTFDEAYCATHSGFVPGDFVLLAVSDDGCGMHRNIREKIFEPFFTTKGVNEGSGLGLSTVYGMVKQNNGFINVYSEPGKGSTFKIYLARHVGEHAERPAQTKSELEPGQGETILLVEDETVVLNLGKRMLESLGYHVLTASTPDEALQLAGEQEKGIDLLITDVVMPEVNGRELAKQVSTRCPGVKTLFMSGYTADVIAHRGVLDEGVNFIQKPFSIEDLASKVRTLLTEDEGKQPIREKGEPAGRTED